MNKLNNKLVSIALSVTTLVSLSGAILPAVAQAQSTSDLQAQIAALLAQIQQLQGQLNTGNNNNGGSFYNFTRDLTVGSKGDDVMALQRFLNGHGALVSGSGVGSPGNESTYFGTLTKGALAQWQGSHGVSPAVGYFGPKTRAMVASMAVNPSPTPTPGPGPSPSPSPIAPASGLWVSLASDNPAPGSLIPSSSRNRVLRVTLTAGNSGPVTVTELKFHKQGVLSDSSIAGAYIQETGRVLAQYNSISAGVVDFANLSLTVPAGQSRTFSLAIDPASGLSAGNTVSFGMNAATDIVAWDASNNAVTAQGSFPVSGNIFTVTTVSNPSLASLTVASSSIGTQVTAGTTNNLVAAWNFTVSNSKSNLSSIKFTVIGSANKNDIRNLKLMVNGTQIGGTLSSVGSNGEAFFDASAAPGVLNTGSNNVQVYADVMGSPSYNFQLELLNAYDIYAWDSQYNVPIAGQSNIGTQITIKAGTITVSQAVNTPTGSIAAGQSGVVLARFTVTAAGEAVKIKWLGVGLNITGQGGGSINDDFRNLSLVDDAGGQVGTTINTLSTAGDSSVTTCTDTAASNTSSTYRSCFGNSSSPINYIIPANTTRVLSVLVDVQSTAAFTSVAGVLTGNTSNLQGLSSSQTASSASGNGSALSLVSSNLAVAANTALGTQNISANSMNRKIGSYAFSASSAEGVTVNNISVQARGNMWANLKVMVGSTQFGSTQGSVASGTVYSFSGNPFTVPAGTTQYVDIYGDSLSSASGTVAPATVLNGCSASGAVSLTAINCSSVNGQNLTFAGQSSLTITIDSATPASQQLVMGSTGNTLAIFRFTETSNVEDIKITDLNVMDTVNATSGATTVKSGFGNVALYNGSSLVATAGSANTSVNGTSTAPGSGYYYSFHFATPVVVPQANSVSITLKGDVSSYASSGATDNTTHIFKIATTTDSANDTVAETVVALGNTSNATSAATLSSAVGNTMTLLRTKLTVTGTALGTTSGRSKSSVDDLATLNFAANSAGGAQINTVSITFSGSAPSGTGTGVSSFWQGSGGAVTLYDPANGTSYNASLSSTSKLSFNLAGYQLSAGSSKSFNIRVNDTATNAMTTASTGVSQSLSATIAASTDITWSDSLDSAATAGLNIESYVTPVNITSVSYAAGS